MRGVEQLIHPPSAAAQALVKWARFRKETEGVGWGIPAIDEVVVPLRPGETAGIVGRPGHCKSSLLAYLSRHTAKRLQAAGAEDRVVVHCTWEESVEQLQELLVADPELDRSDLAWGRADMEQIKQVATERCEVPIWTIGLSVSNLNEVSTERPPAMTPGVVLEAIDRMEGDYGVKPELLLFDYLQEIPSKGLQDRVAKVTELPHQISEIATRVRAPAVYAVQARREVDDRRDRCPEPRDAQWASAIEQSADHLYGVTRPIRYLDRGDIVGVRGYGDIAVTPELLIVRLTKQRGGIGRRTWAMYFDPATLELGELNVENLEGSRESDSIPF